MPGRLRLNSPCVRGWSVLGCCTILEVMVLHCRGVRRVDIRKQPTLEGAANAFSYFNPLRQAAEEVAEAALGRDSRDAWAMHALAHVHGPMFVAC